MADVSAQRPSSEPDFACGLHKREVSWEQALTMLAFFKEATTPSGPKELDLTLSLTGKSMAYLPMNYQETQI